MCYSCVTRMYSYVVHMCSLSRDLCHNDHRTIANKLALIITAKNTTVSPDLEVFLEGLKYSAGNLMGSCLKLEGRNCYRI